MRVTDRSNRASQPLSTGTQNPRQMQDTPKRAPNAEQNMRATQPYNDDYSRSQSTPPKSNRASQSLRSNPKSQQASGGQSQRKQSKNLNQGRKQSQGLQTQSKAQRTRPSRPLTAREQEVQGQEFMEKVSKLTDESKGQKRKKRTAEARVYSEERERTNSLARPNTRKQPPVKKKKKGFGLIMAIIVILLVSVGGYFGYNWIMANKPENMDDLRTEILSLYTDDSKKDLNQTTTMEVVTELYTKVENVDSEGNDKEKEGLLNELNTLKMYITHIDKLDKMSAPDYDIGTPEFDEEIRTIRAESMDYKVPTLTTTIAGRISVLASESRSLNNLKQELIGVSSDKDRDPTEYIAKIQSDIKHNPNKEALSNVVSYISEKQEIIAKLDELNKDKSKNKKEIKAQQEALTDLQSKINDILAPSSTN